MTTYRGRPIGDGVRIALVCSRFNDLVVERLEQGARRALVAHGTDPDGIDTVWTPGAWEIPAVVSALAASGRYDALVGLGAVLRGETYHFEVVANHSAAGLMAASYASDAVVTNGILTVDTLEQALDRAGGKSGNKGAEAAVAALEMLDVLRQATP